MADEHVGGWAPRVGSASLVHEELSIGPLALTREVMSVKTTVNLVSAEGYVAANVGYYDHNKASAVVYVC